MGNTTYNVIPEAALAASDEAGQGRRNQLVRVVEEIYRECYQDLLRYLLLSGCDGADANDFLQEAFLRMVQQLKQGKPIESPKYWLLRVLRNIRYDEQHRASRYVAVDAGDLESILNRSASQQPSQESTALSRERREQVRVALGTLTERQYQCVLLRANGLKLREIAELFGISAVTVAEACGRAMEKLGRLQYE